MSEPTSRASRGPQGMVSPFERSGKIHPLTLFREVIQILAALAIVVTTILIYMEVKTARMAYQQNADIHKQMLTDTWIERLRDSQPLLAETQRYLGNPEIPESAKIDVIHDDLSFQGKVNDVLSMLEEIALLYNLGSLHEERIERGPRGVIVDYYKDARFWIEYRRENKPRLYRELASMVEALE